MQNGAPLVSIIIPCYKAEKELPSALDSIARQTHTNWEVLVVNDCWQDSTEDIVNQFQKSYPNNPFKFFRHSKNEGLGATRNTGIKAAAGDFVAFLDHDDRWDPKHLEHALTTMSRAKADIYYSPVLVFNADGTGNDWIWGPTQEDLDQFPQSIFNRNFIQPSSAVFSREFITRLGPMDTAPAVHFCEDHDYWIRAVNLGAKFVTTSEVTAHYRYANPDAATSKIPLMIEHDISVQKKHLGSTVFFTATKHRAIAGNYRRLANFFWKSHHVKSLWFLTQSIYWCPRDLGTLRQFIKGIFYWPFLSRKLNRA
ncbi:MAG: glycosyltransferase family 2 protein [Proteobacteria bacterium]|nr:glycosyltransferase family 2 protein [Pseudomonadota bacterium]